jgi:RNA polymerase sigma-70 factor (ECF subfamily)
MLSPPLLGHTGNRIALKIVPKNEASAFVANLAAEYGRDLVRFISKRMRSSIDARDIAQETYVRLLRLDRQDLIRDPRPYLYRIAANLLYEAELRRRASATAVAQLVSDAEASAREGYEEIGPEMAELREHLERAMEGLSAKCRAVLLLHRCEQMTYDEIGAELGISDNMVKKYLAQGLKHCRQRLVDLGRQGIG